MVSLWIEKIQKILFDNIKPAKIVYVLRNICDTFLNIIDKDCFQDKNKVKTKKRSFRKFLSL